MNGLFGTWAEAIAGPKVTFRQEEELSRLGTVQSEFNRCFDFIANGSCWKFPVIYCFRYSTSEQGLATFKGEIGRPAVTIDSKFEEEHTLDVSHPSKQGVNRLDECFRREWHATD